MRGRVVAALAAALLLSAPVLAACGDDGVAPPGEAKVDVDTPELRELKAAAGVEDCAPGTGQPVEQGLPEVTLACFGGGPDVDLAALRGPLVLNFWAAWCGPCREEMPVIQAFHERFGDRVTVMGVDYNDPQPERAMQLVGETGVTYPLLADPQERVGGSGSFAFRGLPLTAFVDADGQVAGIDAGEIESVDELVDLVERHLGVAL
ncbi:TlpA family protein disulfide reductase [Nocardioides ferulae]|uniref:TlpA family protein disulfide reductase n=1 Tax=Nocardioides ferulae TaxID=2340821 RepID=UPI0013DD8D73|nr:TlpA disulfide reductase family protein [Nocardioides ferulae]